MRFTQFYLESLGHASYFVGAEDTGEALLIGIMDPFVDEAVLPALLPHGMLRGLLHIDVLSSVCGPIADDVSRA